MVSGSSHDEQTRFKFNEIFSITFRNYNPVNTVFYDKDYGSKMNIECCIETDYVFSAISVENLELGSGSNSSEESEMIQGKFSNLKDSTFCLDTEWK